MILVAGLTPAWQQILVFDHVERGEVNRAKSAHWTASGKAVNAALAVHTLGGQVRLVSPFGGLAGQHLRDNLERGGVATRWIETQSPTRVCTTLVESGTTTELVENSHTLFAIELSAFVQACHEEAHTAKCLVLSGSLTPGAPSSLYRDLLADFQGPTLLDARGPELAAALAGRPLLVKPNREELAQTVGRPLATTQDIRGAMLELQRRGAQWVVVTAGAEPIEVLSPEGFFRLRPPQVTPVNAIGCGDCFCAGIAWALDDGQAMLEALKLGLGAAADNLSRLLPARLNAERVRAFAARVEVSSG